MAKKQEEETMTISKVAVWQTVSAVLVILLVVSIFTSGFGFSPAKTGTGNTGTNTNNGGTGNTGGTATVNLEGAHKLGDDDAPVKIIEWSDFQCPFCGRFYTDTEGQIVDNYVDSGDVQLIYKHFPLESIHPMALPAALASECADEQGKFWEYHNYVFENQASLTNDNLKVWAGTLGLDTAKFNSCLDSQKYLDKVNADLQEGLSAGIRGTPGFLINGQLVSGAQPYAVFQQAIDSSLG